MQPVASSRIVSKIKARKNCFINHPFRLLNHVQLHFNKIIDLLNLHCGLFPLILQIPIYLADRQTSYNLPGSHRPGIHMDEIRLGIITDTAASQLQSCFA